MTVLCEFCNTHPVSVTVTRTTPGQAAATLSLCERCGYIHQVVAQVAGLERAMPAPPCLMCRKLSVVTGETKNKEGQLLGRFRLCKACAQRQDYSLADVLGVATPWTPGVLELPAPGLRVFPEPPWSGKPGNN